MIAKTVEKKQWRWVNAAHYLPLPLSIPCAFFGFLALVGYFCNIEDLYRPIANGPATHPLTAVSVLLLGLGIAANGRARNHWLEQLCMFLAIGISVFRLGDALFHVDLISWMTPFRDTVLLDQRLGKENNIGINTAGMLLCIAVALQFHGLRMSKCSQIAASLAIAIPVVSFTGYAYGLEHFYGQMSLLTAATGFVLASATLAMTADRAALRAILSPYIGGRIARAQVAAGYLIPTGLGYILIKSFMPDSEQAKNLFGIFVVAISWFVILMVGISAFFHEKVDFARRQSELKLSTSALRDSLTGLPNRRWFFEWSQSEIERTRLNGSELWVLMIDLDHFKNINDTAGHAIGDRVLIAVAQLLSRSIRKTDMVGRLGGEEFAVVLANLNQAGVAHMAEHIRQNIELLAVPGWTDIHGPVTTSIGCARLGDMDTLKSALQAADEALYQAKKNGRNRIIFGNRVRRSI